MLPIEEVIPLRLIPAITDGYIYPNNERKLFALPIKFSGYGLLDSCEPQNIEYRNSREVTKGLIEDMILLNKIFEINTEEIKKSKNKLKSEKNIIYQKKLNEATANVDEQSTRCIDAIWEAISSNWLGVVPVKEYNYLLNKQHFWDGQLKNNRAIPGLPTTSPYGEKFNGQHVLSCKKVGLITIRNNEVRDITAWKMWIRL